MPAHGCPFRTAKGIGVLVGSAFFASLLSVFFKIYINNACPSRGVSKFFLCRFDYAFPLAEMCAIEIDAPG